MTASTSVSVNRPRTTVQPNVVPTSRPLAYSGQRTLPPTSGRAELDEDQADEGDGGGRDHPGDEHGRSGPGRAVEGAEQPARSDEVAVSDQNPSE